MLLAGVVLVVAVQVVAAPLGVAAPARCPGDCDSDGRVAVGELIAGVNIALERADVATCENMDGNGDGRIGIGELIAGVASALDGCPCPFDLLDERAGQDEACVFAGRWNEQCGDSALPATFSVRDGLVGVAVVTGDGTPTLTFFGQPLSGREAVLIGYMFGDDAVQLGGTIRLSDDGRELTINPDTDPGVAIDACAFQRFSGGIEGIVSTREGGGVSVHLERVENAVLSGPRFETMP